MWSPERAVMVLHLRHLVIHVSHIAECTFLHVNVPNICRWVHMMAHVLHMVNVPHICRWVMAQESAITLLMYHRHVVIMDLMYHLLMYHRPHDRRESDRWEDADAENANANGACKKSQNNRCWCLCLWVCRALRYWNLAPEDEDGIAPSGPDTNAADEAQRASHEGADASQQPSKSSCSHGHPGLFGLYVIISANTWIWKLIRVHGRCHGRRWRRLGHHWSCHRLGRLGLHLTLNVHCEAEESLGCNRRS